MKIVSRREAEPELRVLRAFVVNSSRPGRTPRSELERTFSVSDRDHRRIQFDHKGTKDTKFTIEGELEGSRATTNNRSNYFA